MFGGIWVNGFYELMNDLWKYNMNTGEWTWLKGSTTSNVGGNCSGYGVANGSNTPGARKGAAFWNDGAGNPPNPNGLKTDYLWKRILTRDGLTDVLENYARQSTYESARRP